MKTEGSCYKQKQGGALLWVLLVVAVAGIGFYLWQKSRRKPVAPPVVVVAATPIPATPPPATPKPVVVKATPTPRPIVVVATPAPTPTPPLLDLATVARTPALWPQSIVLVQPTAFPLSLNGRAVGEVKAPAGTALRMFRVHNQHVEVEYQNARHFIPVVSTDLMPRALATFRANGSVLPAAPAPSTTTTPVAGATPPPAAQNPVRVEVTADRKRTDLIRDTRATRGQASDTVEKCVYSVKVQNRSFGDAPELDFQYVIFVERQRLGEKKDKDTIERIPGSGKVKPLSRKEPIQIVPTSEFELHKRELVGGYFYANGGREKVEDNIAGVWVKVMHEGKVIGEYTNPSTVTKRGWDAKSSTP